MASKQLQKLYVANKVNSCDTAKKCYYTLCQSEICKFCFFFKSSQFTQLKKNHKIHRAYKNKNINNIRHITCQTHKTHKIHRIYRSQRIYRTHRDQRTQLLDYLNLSEFHELCEQTIYLTTTRCHVQLVTIQRDYLAMLIPKPYKF